ncbi:MAG: glycosyltransferase family A protein [Ginsengibacter sp.]
MNTGISVIIPTYNREKFVGEAIESVLIQEYHGKIEIIISDDGSTDNTLSIASAFGDVVKTIKKPADCNSQGASGARNRGIAAATQPFLCFLDSDDFYVTGHLKKMAKVLEDDPNLGFVFCRILECEEKNGKRMFRQWTHPKVFKEDIKNPVVSRSHIVHTNSFMFRKEVFKKVGFFNETYSNGEDGDLWMRISELYKGAFADHFGAIYKISHNDNQLSKNKEDEIKECYFKIYKKAISRYYKLNLKDHYRIFKLKHILLNLSFKNKKNTYYPRYLGLILRYPVSPWFIIKEYFYNKEKKRNNDFREDLSSFFS